MFIFICLNFNNFKVYIFYFVGSLEIFLDRLDMNECFYDLLDNLK